MQEGPSPNSPHGQPRSSLRKRPPQTGHLGSVTLSYRDRTSRPSRSTCSLTGNKGMTLQRGIPAKLGRSCREGRGDSGCLRS